MLLSFLLFASAQAAPFRPLVQCSVRDRLVATRKRDLPAAVLRAMPYRLADRGEPFRATDVVLPGQEEWPSARLICGYRIPGGYVVEREQGGIGYDIGKVVLRRTSTGFAVESPNGRPPYRK